MTGGLPFFLNGPDSHQPLHETAWLWSGLKILWADLNYWTIFEDKTLFFHEGPRELVPGVVQLSLLSSIVC